MAKIYKRLSTKSLLLKPTPALHFLKTLPTMLLLASLTGSLQAQTFPVQIPTLPQGKTITITYKATINKPLNPRSTLTVADQIALTGQGIGTILSDDPDTPTPNDSTVTSVLGCHLLSITAGMPVCGENNTYSVDLTVAQDGGAPLTGNLVVEAGGKTFTTPVAPNQTAQLITISLPANGQPVDVKAYYSDLPDCELLMPALFTAPQGCGIIGSRVWEDINGDGIQNDGPGGIANATVVLLDCNNQPITQTLTDANGEYQFTNLPAGQYKLRFNFSTAAPAFVGAVATKKDATSDTIDSDIDSTFKETPCFTLNAGQQTFDWDAGVYVPAQIGNLAWVDKNHNNYFDGGDTPLAGVPVSLYRCSDSTATTPLATQTTGSNGLYLFTGLAPGSYKVKFGFPATSVYERVVKDVGGDTVDSDADADGITGCYTVKSQQQELSVDAGYTFCPPTTTLVCRGSVNVNMGDDCLITVTPDILLTTAPPCFSTYEVRIRDSRGRNIGNILTSEYVGQTLQATVIDKQTNASCSSNISIFDQRKPVITCPPNTNKASYSQQIQLINSTLTQINSSANLSNYSCFSQIINPASGNHYYELYPFTVSKEDVYTFELSSDFGDGAALLYLGNKDANNSFCENVMAQSYVSYMNGVYFTQLNPITRITMRLVPGQTYTLLTTSKAPGATGAYFWAAYSDGSGLINGIQAVSTQAQYDLICTDVNQILNNNQSLAYTGSPVVTDNCSRPVTDVTFTDQLVEGSDCNSATITRTFTARDASGNTAQCSQLISIRKPTLADVIYPALTVFLECSDEFNVDINGNPHPMVTGYPLVKTAFGNYNLATTYCNISATYSDKPRATGCGETYNFVREWTITDLCNITNILKFTQVIRVGDSTPPIVTCPSTDANNDGTLDTLIFSTTPFECTATFDVPRPGISDNCSSSTFTADILSDTLMPIYNEFGDVIDFQLQQFVRASVQSTGSLQVKKIPIGLHYFRYTVTDACGNKTVIECPFKVEDRIEPTVVCKNSLAISLGGEGVARILATDIDEGSRDNCAIDSILVRRRYTKDPLTCQPVSPYFSNWGTFIDITCCDADTIVYVEMRVIDKAKNYNECIVNVEVKDMVRPFCVAPAPVSIPCTSLPKDFNPQDTMQLRALFGVASATDNCIAHWEELAPIVNLSDCRVGTIIRRFRTVDRTGNVSVNTCQQVVTITRVNHYTIKFPKDADIECGMPFADTLQMNSVGCDQLSVSVSEDEFSPIGNECFRIFRTYRVINWCEYDGVSQPVVIGRDEDCDNKAGDEDVWVIRRPTNTFIDQNNVETDNIPAANTRTCTPTNPKGYWRTATSLGYWQYTQILRVFDHTAPDIIFSTPQPFCSESDDCNATVSVPFVVSEGCRPGSVTVQVSVDVNNDGSIDGTLTSYGGNVNGTFPNFEINGTFPKGKHAFAITVKDGCNNSNTEKIPFEVVDCKAPTPTCRSSIVVNLKPVKPPRDLNGDGIEDRGAITVKVSELLNGTASDCSGPVRYSMNKMGDVPNINLDSIVLTCTDLGTSIPVEIYAWDNAANPYAVQPNGIVGGPNYSSCIASINVLDAQFGACAPPKQGLISGYIKTEANKPVENVQVSLSGKAADTIRTALDGTYQFAGLEEGYDYTVAPLFDEFHQNGVNTIDLIIITKHILGVQPLDSPYKIIAADVNNSKSISIVDLIQLRKLILGVDLKFPENTSWRFVRSSYIFPVQSNPWFEEFPEVTNINDLTGTVNPNFVAIKIGDVNLTAITTQQPLTSPAPRGKLKPFTFEVEDRDIRAGETYTVDVNADISNIQGYQLTFDYDKQKLELSDVKYGRAREDNFGFQAVEQGFVTTSWDEIRPADLEGDKNVRLFSFVFTAKANGRLSDMLKVSSRFTPAEAYNYANETLDVAINFGHGEPKGSVFELYQNVPNPFDRSTTIGFYLPEATSATLKIYDAKGRILKIIHGEYNNGFHQVVIDKSELSASGVLYYTLESERYNATRKMLLLE